MNRNTVRLFSVSIATAALLLLIGSLLSAAPRALSQPPPPNILADPQYNTVFVYNGTTDTFNNNAQGFIWQSLGLLDANGKPGRVQGDDIVDDAGNVLGHVIRDGDDKIIGYTNKDRTQAAYDVSNGATTSQAWQAVAANGELHIIKHGAFYVGEDGKTRLNGGGIQLDNGQTYDGFDTEGGGDGTGFGYDGPGPYRLPQRPGANIKMNLNSCYSSNDPDGEGPATSVTESAGNVPGVGSTQGHQGKVRASVTWRTSGGNARQQRAALAALRGAAKKAGFKGDDAIGQWIASLSFADQYRVAQAAIDAAVGSSGIVRLHLSYSKAEVSGSSLQASSAYSGTAGYYVPPMFFYPTPFTITYAYTGAIPGVHLATLVIPGMSQPAPTYIMLDQRGDFPAPLPPGQVLNSPMMEIRARNTNTVTFPSPPQLILHYYHENPAHPLQAYFIHEGHSNWIDAPLVSHDPVMQNVVIDVVEPGIYAVMLQVAHGFTLTPTAQTAIAAPEQTVTYTLTVTNTGDYTDTFALDVASQWPVDLPDGYLVPELGPSQAEHIAVAVTIPITVAHLASDTAVLTVTSGIADWDMQTAHFTTTADYQPGVALAIEPLAATGAPGEHLTYAVTLTNTGGYTDSFTLDLTAVWTATISPAAVTDLGVGRSLPLTVTVVIPLSATHGISDTVTLIATSANDPQVFASIAATTTALVPDELRYYLYLPLVARE